jgi:pimeloyl-ACP methyl ester carboxylesterase
MAALGLPMRLGPIRRATFAPFAKHKIPPDVIDSWVEPGRDAAIRRDTGRFVAGMNKRYTMEAAERLRSFDRPVLLAWAPEDRLFKLSDAERLAEAIPDATLKTIADARTFVPLDQPARVAELIGEFLAQDAKAEQAA